MQIVEASDGHIRALMSWFDDAPSVRTWGGPRFRYPFNERTFRDDLKLQDMHSYALIGDSPEMIAFGQTYLKAGRGHLARLAVAPSHRGKGVGVALVERMVEKAREQFACSEYSLYVLSENAAARRCYEKAGFREAVAPGRNEEHDGILYMVRRSRRLDSGVASP